MLVRTRTGRRWRALLVVVALAIGVVGAPNFAAIAAPGDVGYQGPGYAGTTNPTAPKPESKLWFNDGSWWGSLYDAVAKKYQIQRLDLTTQTWQTTGVLIDNRGNTRADALWDGSKLYVASHVYSTSPAAGYPARLYRYSYDTTTKTYSLDAGFPATISDYRSETLVIDKASTGQLWATWTEGNKVWINRTIGNDSTWGTPFTPSITGAANLKPDDISSLVAFGPGKIGLMWSNQNASTMYFSVHDDAADDTIWGASETAIGGSKNADDHINLKTDGNGRVMAITKTSQTSGNATIVAVLVRGTNGSWTDYPAWRVSDVMTRPILLYDETHQELRVFASRESGGTIFTKRSPLSQVSFPVGVGDTFIRDATIDLLNNATSTKQNVSSTTGLVVLASQNSDKRYWHNVDLLGGSPPPPPTPPTADFTATPTSGQADLAVAFTDTSSGAPTSWSWTFGDGGTSTSRNPSHTYASAGTYTVSLTASNPSGSDTKTRTDYITVTAPPPPGPTLTFTPVADAHVRSLSPTSNYGLDPQLRVRDGSSDGTVTFNAYLKFDVSGVTSSIVSATLRLWVDTGTANGGTVYPTTDNWTETGLTWNTAPAIGSTAIAGIGRTTTGTWVDIPLGAGAIVPGAMNAFAIRSVTTSSAYYSSRQGANPPQLVITLSN